MNEENVVHVNPFNHENTSYMSDEFIVECINNHIKGINKLIKAIHYNIDHPENHNIVYDQETDKEIIHYKTHAELVTNEELINILIKSKIKFMIKFIKQNPEIYDEAAKANLFEDFIETLINTLN